jgi:hypothetical protein
MCNKCIFDITPGDADIFQNDISTSIDFTAFVVQELKDKFDEKFNHYKL